MDHLASIRTFLRVAIPGAGSGLVAGLALAWGRALGEFGATTLVAGSIEGKTRTLALAIFDDIQMGNLHRARILLGIAVVIAFGAITTVSWLQRRDREQRGEEHA